jgi:hypothetical protein
MPPTHIFQKTHHLRYMVQPDNETEHTRARTHTPNNLADFLIDTKHSSLTGESVMNGALIPTQGTHRTIFGLPAAFTLKFNKLSLQPKLDQLTP